MNQTFKEKQNAVLKMMNNIPFFEHFSTYEKKRFFSTHANFVQYGTGSEIIIEGEMDTCFYILFSGSVAIKKKGVELSYLGVGEFFGEMAFLADTVRTTSVEAREPVVLFRIDRPLMARLSCEIREKIKDQCIFKLVERVDKLTERLRVRM